MRALLWEGYSLRQAGEDDLALAIALFGSAFLLVDLALNRARAAMGLPVVDNGYGDLSPILRRRFPLCRR